MTDTRRVLGQCSGAKTTVVTAYTCPAGKNEAIVSSLIICNRATSATTCCAWVVTAADVNSQDEYIYYDLPLPANETFVATLGLTLSGSDQLRVEGADGNLTWSVFGVEIS